MDLMCRTCMRSVPNLLPLFNNNNYLKIKIETLTSIEIIEDNTRFPSNICGECVDNINRFYNFRIVIINNDLDFRMRYLAPQLQTIDENDDNTQTSEDHTQTSETPAQQDLDISVSNILKDENFEVDIETRLSNSDIPTVLRKSFKCTECDFKATCSIKLQKHKRKCHYTVGICNVCGKSMRTDNLGKHIKSHAEEKVTCPECGKDFKNSESLRAHSHLHSNNTIFCEVCGNSYKSRGEYNRHKKSHTGVCKKSCPFCDKEYPAKTLKSHIRTHTGERPYSCKHCPKVFRTSYARNLHTRLHTNDRPHKCEYCPMGFVQKAALKSHLASKH